MIYPVHERHVADDALTCRPVSLRRETGHVHHGRLQISGGERALADTPIGRMVRHVACTDPGRRSSSGGTCVNDIEEECSHA